MQDKLTRKGSDFISTKEIAAHPITEGINTLNKAGTMQLRTIAKIMHVKNYTKLKRDQLILAIIAKKEELWQVQQQELWQDTP
jgi:hypothetical protein